jgi:hypothetical protein
MDTRRIERFEPQVKERVTSGMLDAPISAPINLWLGVDTNATNVKN